MLYAFLFIYYAFKEPSAHSSFLCAIMKHKKKHHNLQLRSENQK